MELEANWPRVLKIWWALAWRMMVAGLISVILGTLIFFAGRALGMTGTPLLAVVVLIAALVWLAASIVPLMLVLGSSFDGFRLVLLPSNVILPQQDEGDTDTTIRV